MNLIDRSNSPRISNIHIRAMTFHSTAQFALDRVKIMKKENSKELMQ